MVNVSPNLLVNSTKITDTSTYTHTHTHYFVAHPFFFLFFSPKEMLSLYFFIIRYYLIFNRQNSFQFEIRLYLLEYYEWINGASFLLLNKQRSLLFRFQNICFILDNARMTYAIFCGECIKKPHDNVLFICMKMLLYGLRASLFHSIWLLSLVLVFECIFFSISRHSPPFAIIIKIQINLNSLHSWVPVQAYMFHASCVS